VTIIKYINFKCIIYFNPLKIIDQDPPLTTSQPTKNQDGSDRQKLGWCAL